MKPLLGRSFGFCLLLACSCAHIPPAPPTPLNRYEFEQPQMGVPFRIVLYASNSIAARAATQAAFARVEQLNNILSDYDVESELSQLSRGSGRGEARKVSHDLWQVLQQSQELAPRTGGAFDITVGPAVQLWRKARRDHQLPTTERLERARRSIGYQHVRLDPARQTVELLVPDMRLDVGGIAKGYAVDQALLVLRTNGISHALVAGAGDLAVLEPPPGKKGWRVEVAPLDTPEAPPARFVLLRRAALATSGDVFQHLEVDGVRYSHILDPRTAIGLTNQSLVTIIAPDCTTADSLATAVSVLGPKPGLALITKTPNTAAYLVSRHGSTFTTAQSRRFNRHLDRTPE